MTNSRAAKAKFPRNTRSLRSGDPEFAAARILKSWNGWKKGTTANMQVNDQEDNIRK